MLMLLSAFRRGWPNVTRSRKPILVVNVSAPPANIHRLATNKDGSSMHSLFLN